MRKAHIHVWVAPFATILVSVFISIAGCLPPQQECTPGATQSCSCADGDGQQTCSESGESWGSCFCDDADAGSADGGVADAARDDLGSQADAACSGNNCADTGVADTAAADSFVAPDAYSPDTSIQSPDGGGVDTASPDTADVADATAVDGAGAIDGGLPDSRQIDGFAADAATSTPDATVHFPDASTTLPDATCVPSCSGLECGLDPTCGISCGDCTSPDTCNGSGQCVCIPDCDNRICGLDPLCQTSCGECSGGTVCDDGSCNLPDVTFSGGSITTLQQQYPTLTFGQLTITGALTLDPGQNFTLTVQNLDLNAGILPGYEDSDCDYRHGSDLTINATGTVNINDIISLSGESGDAEPPNASCVECFGKNGGDLTISAANINIDAPIHSNGGYGSNVVVVTSPLLKNGCSGGSGGNVTLTASDTITVTGNHRFVSKPGSGGYGTGGGVDGDAGSDGNLSMVAPTVEVTEHEPNARTDIADLTATNDLVLRGTINQHDDNDNSDSPQAFNYQGDFLEDLFELSVTSQKLVTFDLSCTSCSSFIQGDIEIFLFDRDNPSIDYAMDTGSAINRSISHTLPAGRYYLGISYNGELGSMSSTSPYSYTVHIY